LTRKRFVHRGRKLVKRVHSRKDDQTCDAQFAFFARADLARVVRPYIEAAAGELTDPHALHAFRIQGKQVRYAMEVFAGAFDPEFRRTLYPLVATLQERLGEVNDHVTAESHLAAWHDEVGTGPLAGALDAMRQLTHEWLESSRQSFLTWWTAERRDDLRREFSRYVPIEGQEQQPRIDELAG